MINCENALNEVKRRIAQPPIFTFYDQEADFVLQVDSSKDGLGLHFCKMINQ